MALNIKGMSAVVTGPSEEVLKVLLNSKTNLKSSLIDEKKKRTVVIWSDASIRYFVVDGDYSHLNQKYMDSSGISLKDSEGIYNLGMVQDGKKMVKVPMSKIFPREEVIAGAVVIVTGNLP